MTQADPTFTFRMRFQASRLSAKIMTFTGWPALKLSLSDLHEPTGARHGDVEDRERDVGEGRCSGNCTRPRPMRLMPVQVEITPGVVPDGAIFRARFF
jgi:hypothetical protein